MNIHKQMIERVTITGHNKDRDKAFKYTEKHGLRIRRSGPRIRADYTVVPNRFKIVAERKLPRIILGGEVVTLKGEDIKRFVEFADEALRKP